MKLPDSPYPDQPQSQPDNPSGFSNFIGNTNFLRHVSDPNLPEKGTGAHVPLWVSPRLAHQLLVQHGESGHIVPHPNIDINDLSK